MANITCNYYSSVLMSNITFNVVIPTPSANAESINDPESNAENESMDPKQNDTKFPVVYLLHGAYGNYASWSRFSNVERYAQEYNCAVVMASGGNNFYQDMVHGPAYETFFTKELPALVTSLFSISRKKEDTYIAGFSMGGYGAWYLALSHPDLYAKAASMSGALDIAQVYQSAVQQKIDNPFPWDDIFENPGALEGSDKDLLTLYKNCADKGEVPELYQACGTEDFLYHTNVSVYNRLREMNASISYHEGPGAHDWDFWDTYIRHILNWMFSKAE